MAFIREIKRGKRSYYYLVENYRENDKVKQRNLNYLGTRPPPRGMAWSGPDVKFTVDKMLRPKPVKTATDDINDLEKLASGLVNKLNRLDTLKLVGKSPLDRADGLALNKLGMTLAVLQDVIKELIAKIEVDEVK